MEVGWGQVMTGRSLGSTVVVVVLVEVLVVVVVVVVGTVAIVPSFTAARTDEAVVAAGRVVVGGWVRTAAL